MQEISKLIQRGKSKLTIGQKLDQKDGTKRVKINVNGAIIYPSMRSNGIKSIIRRIYRIFIVRRGNKFGLKEYKNKHQNFDLKN